MTQSRIWVNTIINEYGEFNHYRYNSPITFVDYVRTKLKRGNTKSRTITSKNIVEWTPRTDSEVRTVALAIWGEMQALHKKPIAQRGNNELHQLMAQEATTP